MVENNIEKLKNYNVERLSLDRGTEANLSIFKFFNH